MKQFTDEEYASKVKYIISHVSNADDAYYLIKALTDQNTRKCVLSDTFLDSHAAHQLALLFFTEPVMI